MSDRLTRADALLAEKRSRLEAVIEGDAWPEIKSLARHYLAKVESWQRVPDGARDLALGAMGPNLYGKSIDDVCARAEFAARQSQPMREEAA